MKYEFEGFISVEDAHNIKWTSSTSYLANSFVNLYILKDRAEGYRDQLISCVLTIGYQEPEFWDHDYVREYVEGTGRPIDDGEESPDGYEDLYGILARAGKPLPEKETGKF